MRYPVACTALWLTLVGFTVAQPAQVIIVRHAKNPDDGNELSLAGQVRAAALELYFRRADELLKIDTPVAKNAQAPKKLTSSVRSFQTIMSSADARHVTVTQSFTRDQYKTMVDEIMHKMRVIS
jgi:hypothetical protein